MNIHVRSTHGGTIIYEGGKLKKINLKTPYTLNQGAYLNWHPDGKHIAYSVNTISQRFFSKDIRQEVSDAASDLIVYDVEKNMVTTSPKVSTSSRENLPVWAADGKSIYYISAPEVTDYESQYNAKFSLMHIPYDVERNIWGDADTVISASKTGKSVTFPKTSPDGKYLMFTLTDHGYFSIHHPDADLYLLNLKSGQIERMSVNSDKYTDSYHCWSSTGRWFVFSSKRIDGLYTRPYFSYFDENGKASKPFVLPQKDPEFYDSFLKNYNIPELITGAVEPSSFDIRELIKTEAQSVNLDPKVDKAYMQNHLRKKEVIEKPSTTEEH
jgi:tricorn protease-like protein